MIVLDSQAVKRQSLNSFLIWEILYS